MKPNIIAITTDAHQFPAAAFLAYRLAQLNPRDDAEVVIFSDSFEDLRQAQTFGVPAELQHATMSVSLPKVGGLTQASLVRLFVPSLVPPNVERILYLDTDTYPENANLFRLFDLDLRDNPLAAVCELFITVEGAREGGVEPNDYFNSGVLLIDRARYVGEKILERTRERMRSGKFNDQIVLNHAVRGRWSRLSPGMNMAPSFMRSFVRDVVPPAISHFMGPNKPWRGEVAFPHPAPAEISQFVERSPWRAWILEQHRKGNGTRDSKTFDRAMVAAYLRQTEFADVAEGITKLNLAAIPEELRS